MTGRFIYELVDYDGTVTQRSWYTYADDTNIATVNPQIATLRTALLDVTRSELHADERSYEVTETNVLQAANSDARNSIRWKMYYKDDVTGKNYTDTIPGADVIDATLVVANTTDWDATNAQWIAFKNAFEVVARSIEGNAVTLQKVELVD